MKSKNIWAVLMLVQALMGTCVFCQQAAPQLTTINSYHIAIGFNKTSNIIFPCEVISADRGNAMILAQKALHASNVLQLKAGAENFAVSNVSVITADGRFYSFLVDYALDPAMLNFVVGKDSLSTALVTMPSIVNPEILERDAGKVMKAKSFLHKKVQEQKIKIRLEGIYLLDSMAWFKMKLHNKSQINYTVNNMRFFIRDKKKIKRSASQEKELIPFRNKKDKCIEGDTKAALLLPLPAFTIPKKQELIIEVSEKSGGRTVRLILKSTDILKAKRLMVANQ